MPILITQSLCLDILPSPLPECPAASAVAQGLWRDKCRGGEWQGDFFDCCAFIGKEYYSNDRNHALNHVFKA